MTRQALSSILFASFFALGCGGESETASFADGGSAGSDAGASGGSSATGGAGSGGTAGSPSGGAAGTGAAGASGAAGTGASAGAGGNAGSSGAGGIGGTGATGGASGGTGGASGGTGGASGGTGGTGGVVGAPECKTANDCKVFNDCCSCEGVPKAENPTVCPALCKQNKCESLGVSPTTVECVAGRCVKGYDCDTSKVTCKAAEPACPSGQVPEVKGNCYTFNCVPANECMFVPSCAKCGGNDVCANYVTQLGPRPHCVSIPTECNGNFTCACMGPSVCLSPFDSCSDLSGPKGVACTCPAC
ncbi:MAG: hypothetical protein R3B13_11530 [Polyangiaceae bacterium]